MLPLNGIIYIYIYFLDRRKIIFMNLINFIRIIRSGELKAQKIDKEELPEFLYYVVKSEDINNIKKDLCINLQHHGTDVCAELNIDLSNTYLFYCFGSLPTKLQYEKSKGTVNTSLSVIKIKYDKDKINKIYFREFDNSLLLPLNSDKFKLELGYFDIIPLDWY